MIVPHTFSLSRWVKRPIRWPRLPNPCLLCSSAVTNERLCTGCRLDLPYLVRVPYVCDNCAVPMETDSRYCGRCLAAPPPFERCRSAFVYEHPMDYLIHQFKYHRQLIHGRALAQLLIEHLESVRAEVVPEEWPQLLVPVPMHWTRRLQRGFNHTEQLARDLGRALDLPVETRLCRRASRTPAQQGLGRRERERNLKRAFVLTGRARRRLAGLRVALVDDVVTTTSTARELSRLLLSGGASEVELWALARTPE